MARELGTLAMTMPTEVVVFSPWVFEYLLPSLRASLHSLDFVVVQRQSIPSDDIVLCPTNVFLPKPLCVYLSSPFVSSHILPDYIIPPRNPISGCGTSTEFLAAIARPPGAVYG